MTEPDVTADYDDEALKTLQADNFDSLNDVVAGTPFDRHMRFFNFGYRPLGDEQPIGPHLSAGFPNHDSAQLLFQVVGDTDLTRMRVTEIGCGRGGNLWLSRRHLGTATVTGVDIAPKSIDYCRRSMPDDDARFEVGDAEAVPLPSGSADVVLSIETSCTYPDIERFFGEVARLLVVGGRFIYTDLMLNVLVEPYIEVLESLGLELQYRRDITANVQASREARAARQRLAYGATPEGDETTMKEYVGVEGSQLFDSLTNGERSYTIMRFLKVADPTPSKSPLLTIEQRAMVRDQAQMAAEVLTIPSVTN